jgi:hypothetical protein
MTQKELDNVGRVLEASIQAKYVDYNIEYIPTPNKEEMINFGYYVKQKYHLGTTIEDLFDDYITKDLL